MFVSATLGESSLRLFPEKVSDALAWGFGLSGMICFTFWPLLRTRHGMLAMQLAALVGISLHYALFGAATAAIVNALGAVQIALALQFGDQPSMRWFGYGLALTMIASIAVTWQGAISILAAIGMVLVSIGRMQRNVVLMRILVLSGGPLWLSHDLIVGSPLAIADAANLCVALGQMAWQNMCRRRPRRKDRRHSGISADGVAIADTRSTVAQTDVAPIRKGSVQAHARFPP